MLQSCTCWVLSKVIFYDSPGVKYLDLRTSLATHVGDFPCIEYPPHVMRHTLCAYVHVWWSQSYLRFWVTGTLPPVLRCPDEGGLTVPVWAALPLPAPDSLSRVELKKDGMYQVCLINLERGDSEHSWHYAHNVVYPTQSRKYHVIYDSLILPPPIILLTCKFLIRMSRDGLPYCLPSQSIPDFIATMSSPTSSLQFSTRTLRGFSRARAHTHTHARTHARAHTHTHTRTRAHVHT